MRAINAIKIAFSKYWERMLLTMVMRWRGTTPPLYGVLVGDQEKAAEGKDYAAICSAWVRPADAFKVTPR